ncbi:putative endonuclease-reverse transcriptase [Trichonephila clavipes]|nr:putative endonuclease-reverse transcriptase [Trichonephila clavipes]
MRIVIDKKCNTPKETIIETGNQVVEKVKKSKKDWFDNDCFMATKRKNEAYSKMLMENTVGDYQNEFWKGRSTTEQIFNIRQALEKTREFGIDMHHLFIDFKTAYDSIHRKTFIAAMKEFEIPDKLLKLISLTLSETKIVVKVQNDLSDQLEIKNGIRQGDVLACLLFNIALEKVESENENEETKLIRNDFAHYVGTPIDADLREQILKLGPYQPEGNFQKDANGRSFSSSYYSFISKARQKIKRKWLCYSTRLHIAYSQRMQPPSIKIQNHHGKGMLLPQRGWTSACWSTKGILFPLYHPKEKPMEAFPNLPPGDTLSREREVTSSPKNSPPGNSNWRFKDY